MRWTRSVCCRVVVFLSLTPSRLLFWFMNLRCDGSCLCRRTRSCVEKSSKLRPPRTSWKRFRPENTHCCCRSIIWWVFSPRGSDSRGISRTDEIINDSKSRIVFNLLCVYLNRVQFCSEITYLTSSIYHKEFSVFVTSCTSTCKT